MNSAGDNTEGAFYAFSIVCFIAGVGFLLATSLLWWVSWHQIAVLLFGAAMLFAGIANGFAFLVLNRMESAGYEVGFWRTFRDFRLYSEYWRIAPEKRWSRMPMVAFIAGFVLAMVLLFSTMWSNALP